jgi:DNA primase
VKAAANIVPVVEGYVRLRKSGGRYVGLCPFHQEKTPSFSVSPDRGTFKCFGCGEGGDTIAFVEKVESVDYVGAIEWLADRFGIQLDYEEVSPEAEARRGRQKRLLELLNDAAAFYERHLWESEAGAAAREYLASRGLGEPVCREFRIGLSAGGATLTQKAQAKGYSLEELEAAGLSRRRTDYFRWRLMFPLSDARGRVVGFQARKLLDDDPLRGKYVNSPESELFRKGDLLYGLSQSRGAIAKEDRAVVVEGNTDVLALRQAGFEPVVASMGTALTERQLKELTRLTRRLFLCFDSDAAGQEATLRGMKLAADQGFEIKVVALPRGTDPADDPAAFQAQLAQAEPLVVYWVKVETERALPDRQAAFAHAQAILAQFGDSPERQDAVRFLADRLGLSRDLQAGLAPRASRAIGAVSPRLLEASARLERSALAGVAAHPELTRMLERLTPEHFELDEHRRMRAHLLGEAPADGELASLLADLHARADVEAIDKETAEQQLLRLRERRLQHELSEAGDDRMLLHLQQELAKVRTAIREFA